LDAHRKIYCNTCKVETPHKLKAVHSHHDEEVQGKGTPYEDLMWFAVTEYSFWVCLGCDTGTLERYVYHSDMSEDEVCWRKVNPTYYPRRTDRDLPQKRFPRLDEKLVAIYREVIESFNVGLGILCAVGLRALLEGICVSRGITDTEAWGLKDKLKKLEEDEHLPPGIVEGLHNFKFMGDDAAHRLEAPTREKLKLAIDFMEELLDFLYEVERRLAYKAKKLADPRRF